MRKISITMLIFIFLVVGGLYIIAFTQTGNNLLKPYLQDLISKKIGQNIQIEKFSLSTNKLVLQASIPNKASLIANGGFKIFSQSFDLDYHIMANNLKTPNIIIEKKLELLGKAVGNIDDFRLKGSGQAFSSNLSYNVHIANKIPLDGVIDAKGLEIAELLGVIAKPAYIDGKLDIVSNIKNTNNSINGDANILIHESLVNEKLIRRDFNFSLPAGVKFVAQINGKQNGNNLNLTSNIVSSLATLSTKKTQLDIKNLNVHSDYELTLPDLSKLEFLTKKRLFGDVKLQGDIQKNGKDVIATAKSQIFDGNLQAIYKNDTLNAQAKDFQLKKILAMLGESALAYGKLNLKADLQNLSKKSKNGTIWANITNGELVGTLLRKKFDVNFPPVTNFNILSNIKLSDEKILADTDLKSSIVNVLAKQSAFDLNSQNFSSNLVVSAKNLTPLGNLINFGLRGDFDAKAFVSKNGDKIEFDLDTKSFGGNMKATFKDDNLNLDLQDILMQKIAFKLNQPEFIKGNLQAKADFLNVTSKAVNGKFELNLKDGFLLGNGLKQLAKNDISYPKSIPLSMKSNIDVKNSFASFSNIINSSLASLPNFNGTYDINNQILDSKYAIKVADLKNLAFITKQVLHGEFNADGIVQMKNKNLKITANAPILGGQSLSVFDKGILTTKATSISAIGLSKLLGFKEIFDSKGDFDFLYNTNTQQGQYKLILDKGHMLPNQLTNVVKTFTTYDMTKEIYDNTLLKGVINKDKASYFLDMKGPNTSLYIPDGMYYMANKKTNANFKFQFQKTDINGKISGEANSPQIKITSSNYLQKKALKALDKHIPNDKKDLVKGILNLF